MYYQANKNEKAHSDNNVLSPPDTFQSINIHLDNNVVYRNNLSENGIKETTHQKISRVVVI